MTKNYTFNHTTKTIILSKSFDKKAKNPLNPEFDELVNLINKLPNYKVTVKVAQWCRIYSLVHGSSLSLFAPILFSQGEGIGLRPVLGVVEGGGQFPVVIDAAPAGLLPAVLAGEV